MYGESLLGFAYRLQAGYDYNDEIHNLCLTKANTLTKVPTAQLYYRFYVLWYQKEENTYSKQVYL